MKNRKRRKPRAPRNLAVLGMILHRKGGPMRDRRRRRPADEDRRRLQEARDD